MRVERPRIWIAPELVTGLAEGLVVEGPARATLPVRYAEAVWEAGGLPAILPPLDVAGLVDALVDGADGVLLAGGDDFDTERLELGPTHPAAKPVPHTKQDLDLDLVRAAVTGGVPLLGICFGMQAMGLASDGRLLQHLPDDRPQGSEHRGGIVHGVSLEADSKLAGCLGVARLDVISRHHQALSDPGRGWRVVGRDPEGLIEAIELPDHPFAIGVQWHPELSPAQGGSAVNERLFRSFVVAARGRSEARNIEAGSAAR